MKSKTVVRNNCYFLRNKIKKYFFRYYKQIYCM